LVQPCQPLYPRGQGSWYCRRLILTPCLFHTCQLPSRRQDFWYQRKLIPTSCLFQPCQLPYEVRTIRVGEGDTHTLFIPTLSASYLHDVRTLGIGEGEYSQPVCSNHVSFHLHEAEGQYSHTTEVSLVSYSYCTMCELGRTWRLDKSKLPGAFIGVANAAARAIANIIQVDFILTSVESYTKLLVNC
jgi:hypothetical protein